MAARPDAQARERSLDFKVSGSVALQRLIGEVADGAVAADITAYNRTYHRHNR